MASQKDPGLLPIEHLEPLETPTQKVFGFLVPPGSTRIKVIDEKGAVRWRKLDEIFTTDAPDLDRSGKPTFISKIGRPPKVELSDVLPPATPAVGDLIKVKAATIRSDSIVQVAQDTPESTDVLHQVIMGLAEEQASMRFERMEAERQGQDTSTLSMRRAQVLKALGDSWIKRKEQLQSRAIDIESPVFEAVLRFMSETFSGAMQSAGIHEATINSVFNHLVKAMEEPSWKNELKSRMKDNG